MRIEFCGLGGVGKTTFVDHNEGNFDLTIFRGKKVNRFRLVIEYFHLIKRIGFSAAISICLNPGGMWLLKKLCLRMAYVKTLSPITKEAFLMADSGVVQPIFSHFFFYCAFDFRLYRILIHALPLPDRLVCLSGSWEVCLERFIAREREKGTIESFDLVRMRQSYKEFDNFKHMILTTLERNGVKVFIFEGDSLEFDHIASNCFDILGSA